MGQFILLVKLGIFWEYSIVIFSITPHQSKMDRLPKMLMTSLKLYKVKIQPEIAGCVPLCFRCEESSVELSTNFFRLKSIVVASRPMDSITIPP